MDPDLICLAKGLTAGIWLSGSRFCRRIRQQSCDLAIPPMALAVPIPSRRRGSGQPSRDQVSRSYFSRHQPPSLLFSVKTGGAKVPSRGRPGFGAMTAFELVIPRGPSHCHARAISGASADPREGGSRADRHLPHEIDELFDCIPRGLDRL